jgi:hypothetical protein
MSHWAEIDNNNKVIRVLVGDNNDPAGDEGYQWLIDNLGGRWIKTSYNANIRYNYAGIGFSYDEVNDAFIPPKPFESWKLSHITFTWLPPKPIPDDGKKYIWDEMICDWQETEYLSIPE